MKFEFVQCPNENKLKIFDNGVTNKLIEIFLRESILFLATK